MRMTRGAIAPMREAWRLAKPVLSLRGEVEGLRTAHYGDDVQFDHSLWPGTEYILV